LRPDRDIKFDHFISADLISDDFWGKKKVATTKGKATMYGPSFVEFNLMTRLGQLIILHTANPLEPFVQKVVHYVYAPRKLGWMGKIVALGGKIQVSLHSKQKMLKFKVITID
jgi:hypothetical protein